MDPSKPQTQNQSCAQTQNDAQSLEAHSELQAQMIELQMSMAHLELTVERLNQVIIRQDKDIQTLQRQLQLIYKQVENQSNEEGVAPFDVLADRPPHY